MSDFMLWLHANYIRPQLDAVPPEDYSAHFDLVKNELPPFAWEELDKCLEFTAKGGPPHSAIKGSIRPKVLGPQTAVTAMVSPYSTFSTLASRYSVSTRPPLS